jgi:hypothetical protein
MKMFMAIFMFSTLSTVVFAGPEDHVNESCYTAKTSVSASVPTTFCFDSLQLNSEKTDLYVSGFFTSMPTKLKVTNAIFVTEDRVKFDASANLVNIWETGCGNGEYATVFVSGVWDIMQGEQINPKELKIKVSYESTNDTCHSPTVNSEIEYVLSK